VATNAAGTAYGQDLTFTTDCLLAGTISAISGPDSVCATSAGNIYSIDPYANATGYIWTIPAGATITAGNNTNSITVTFASNAQSGDFSVYATDGTCFSFPSQLFPVTVSYTPSVAGTITGVQSVCEGDQGIIYSISPLPGATAYTWSVPAGAAIASGQNTITIVVNYAIGSTSGNISVFGSNSCGTGAASYLPVDIAPLPGNAGVITGLSTICAEANNVSYSIATITNAYGYVWTLPPGAEIVSGANTNQVTLHYTAGASSGNLTVYGTNGNCLGLPSPPLFITVNPTPSTPVITLQGDTLISSANAGNQWYLDGVIIPGATGNEYKVVYAGSYTVVVTLNGCSSAISNSILVLPVSISDNTFTNSFEVYPNPSNGIFEIKVETRQSLECSLEIFNNLGAAIWRQENLIIDRTSVTHIDLQNFPAGTYTMIVRNKNNSLFRKILITR
jgi:hypothetical protein